MLNKGLGKPMKILLLFLAAIIALIIIMFFSLKGREIVMDLYKKILDYLEEIVNIFKVK